MDYGIKIIQILNNTWIGKQGDTKSDVLGLGEDGLMYKWHKGTGKWILWVITN